MADHLDDDEQVEALKRWWQENGRSTLTAVVLAVGGTLGWQQYQAWDQSQSATAADTWETVQSQLSSDNSDDVEQGRALAESLKADFSGTVYARFAAMQLAAQAVESGDYSRAEDELRWALAKDSADSELGQLIQLRLARVLAASGDSDAALKILDAGNGAHAAAAYAMARGDIHLAQGREAEALEAYREARASLLALGNPPGILDTKITSLETRLGTSGASS